jgi:hypothetical protein
MFKVSSFEDELMESMAKQLTANAVEKAHGFEKLSKAVDLLAAAAELLDSAGLVVEANDLTVVLESL